MNQQDYFGLMMDKVMSGMYRAPAAHDEDCDCRRCEDEAADDSWEDHLNMQEEIGGV